LLDADGNVVQSTTTDAAGRYRFTGLDLGTYRVNVVDQTGWTQTTREPGDILVSTGGSILNINFGFAGPRTTSGGRGGGGFHWSTTPIGIRRM
jgi:hypothetical protein